MDEVSVARLQVFAIDEAEAAAAVCIVRCVGGIVRPGQRFSVDSEGDSPGGDSAVTLDWIDRYGRRVDFIDPPHNAKVRFFGEEVKSLREGVTVASFDG